MTRRSLLLLLLLTACGTLTSSVTTVNGRAVELVEAGTTGPTVVFEAGLGNDWTAWNPVASEVATRARVFAYSRPGYGRSEPTDAPRDPSRIVEDLRALLTARGFAAPYVLVGHSFGGAYMELFAKLHPEEVAGVVLVDPRHRDFETACVEAGVSGCSIPRSSWSSLSAPQPAELEGFEAAAAELKAASGFGPAPVRVLIATQHGLSAQGEALWQSLLSSLADEAPDGARTVFTGAGHNLEVERPREVAATILSLLPKP